MLQSAPHHAASTNGRMTRDTVARVNNSRFRRPSLIVRAIQTLRTHGPREALYRTGWWLRIRLARLRGSGLTVRRAASAHPATADAMTYPPEVSVIVVTYNAPEDVKRCLESVVGVTVSRTFELIVVDNGSKAALVEWMRGFAGEHESVLMHRLDSNAGFARGVNVGAGLARGPVLILLNSDTVVTDGWLDGPRGRARRPANGGLVSAPDQHHRPWAAARPAGGPGAAPDGERVRGSIARDRHASRLRAPTTCRSSASPCAARTSCS